jgi:hypothetical protein
MRRRLLTGAALVAVPLLWASNSNADVITINGGESPTFPPTFTTLLSAGSPVTLPATVCCGATDSFTVQAGAEGTPTLPSGTFDSDAITVNTGAPGTLILWYTETGLTAPLGTVDWRSSVTSNSLVGDITSVTLSTFISPTNGVSPPNGTLLDSHTFTSMGTQSTTTAAVTGAGPYSLQEVYKIVATGAGSANLTIDLSPVAVVPEPSSFAPIVGIALAGLWLHRRRRRRAA